MIIDIHTHTFPERIAERTIAHLSGLSHTIPFTDGTNEGLKKAAKRAGVDLSVLQPIATSPAQVEHINERAALLNEEHGALLSFGAIHPELPGWKEELKRLKSLGFKGIKLHPVYQGLNLDDVKTLRVIECAASLGLIVLTHTGDDVGYPGLVRCSAEMARHVIDALGEFPLILAHMGGWGEWERVPELLSGRGVYLDTSFSTGSMHPGPDSKRTPEELNMLDEAGFMTLVDAFGADHILFGTDSPWSSIEEVMEFIRGLPVSEKEKEMIFGENAEQLLGLHNICSQC